VPSRLSIFFCNLSEKAKFFFVFFTGRLFFNLEVSLKKKKFCFLGESYWLIIFRIFFGPMGGGNFGVWPKREGGWLLE
jgi:hypothetical protein